MSEQQVFFLRVFVFAAALGGIALGSSRSEGV